MSRARRIDIVPMAGITWLLCSFWDSMNAIFSRCQQTHLHCSASEIVLMFLMYYYRQYWWIDHRVIHRRTTVFILADPCELLAWLFIGMWVTDSFSDSISSNSTFMFWLTHTVKAMFRWLWLKFDALFSKRFSVCSFASYLLIALCKWLLMVVFRRVVIFHVLMFKFLSILSLWSHKCCHINYKTWL